MATMISYSRSDWPLVEPVVKFLDRNHVNMWLDQDQMEPDTIFRPELLRIARESDAFVPFLTERYVESEMCRMELFIARSFDRPIFPVMLEECWQSLDSKEETKYISNIFMARLQALKFVGLSLTRDEILVRLLIAIQNRLSQASQRENNVYISYPNGAADFATRIHSVLADQIIKPWVATKDCEVGQDWRKAQVKAMANAKAHIVVMSEDLLQTNDVLRTEVLMSEAFQLRRLCIKSPTLMSDPDASARVYKHVSHGDQAFRPLAERQWYEPTDIETKLRAAVLRILER